MESLDASDEVIPTSACANVRCSLPAPSQSRLGLGESRRDMLPVALLELANRRHAELMNEDHEGQPGRAEQRAANDVARPVLAVVDPHETDHDDERGGRDGRENAPG